MVSILNKIKIKAHKKKISTGGRQFWGIPNCPNCWSTAGFTFHFNPPKYRENYPSECKNCHCFCNVFGEIYFDK